MKVTNDTNSRKVEPRLAIYLGRSNGDESPSLDSLVIAAGPTSLCYFKKKNTEQCTLMLDSFTAQMSED